MSFFFLYLIGIIYIELFLFISENKNMDSILVIIKTSKLKGGCFIGKESK